jgi:nucleoside-diphosphate-sugar epimerase
MKNILVTGSLGQIGSELVLALRKKFGDEHVIASDIRPEAPPQISGPGPYIVLDVMDRAHIEEIIQTHQIDTIYHLAGLLSATGERLPQKAWDLNINSLLGILELGRKYKLERIFWPSSIAAFGPTTPRENTPNDTILQPSTMYGVTKVSGELLLEYYFKKYGLDTRCMRLPGIISSETPCGGGTTDWAVEIFYDAIEKNAYECFVNEKTTLPMMYMPDLLKAIIQLMDAEVSKLKHHVFNITGMSFSAKDLEFAVKKRLPGFTMVYKPDFRQEIADSWPMTIDDSVATEEWGWHPDFDLESMVDDMLKKLTIKLKKTCS